MGDKTQDSWDITHSRLKYHMPKKNGRPFQTDLFEKILSDTKSYAEPRLDPGSGKMIQGVYLPTQHIWEQQYDPIHVLLRDFHLREGFQSWLERKGFQDSLERFNNL